MSFEALLARERDAELLRFMTCGAVDHGKSTVIGRLLFDSRSVPEDTLEAVRRATVRYKSGSSDLDFALLVDGLRAEREQGITIDVAFRYFSTPRRKLILADVPGHEEYTRNMATAASVCDLALLVVDVREGIARQTRRHAFLAALFGIKHIVVAVNKMDTAGWSEEAFRRVCADFADFSARLDVVDVEFIPVAAATGDNIVTVSRSMPWYSGRPLLQFLENVHIAGDRNLIDLRLPVQLALEGPDGRYFAGTLASGFLRTGDLVAVLPSEKRARVSAIFSGAGNIEEAFAPMAVAVAFDPPLDCVRGDVLAHVNNLPAIGDEVEAMIVWLREERLELGREYLLKHAGATTSAVVKALRYRIDVDDLRQKAAEALDCNEVGRARIATANPLSYDPYSHNRTLGAFLLIDPRDNATAAAGMILRGPETVATDGVAPRD